MKKRKEMDDLVLEISELSDKIEESKKKNKKRRLNCNMGKIAALSKLGAAFTVIPLAGTLISCGVIGWNPFKLNDKEVPKLVTTTIDRDGSEVVLEEYRKEKEVEEKYLTLNYYTKWKETDNGNYTRKRYEYILATDTDIKKLVNLIESGESITRDRVEELVKGHFLGSIGLWMKYHSSDDEIESVIDKGHENEDYIEISWKKFDDSDCIIEKESKNEHVERFFIYAFFEVLLTIIELYVIYSDTCFFEDQFEKLHADPSLIDVKKLQRELNAKQRLFNEYQYETLECDVEDIVLLNDSEEPVQLKKQRLQ